MSIGLLGDPRCSWVMWVTEPEFPRSTGFAGYNSRVSADMSLFVERLVDGGWELVELPRRFEEVRPWWWGRNRWLFNVLYGMDAAFPLPTARGLPADVSATLAAHCEVNQVVDPSRLSITELLTVPWHERLPTEFSVRDNYRDGRLGRADDWIRWVIANDFIPRTLPGDLSPGPHTISWHPEVTVTLDRPLIERVYGFAEPLLMMASLANGDLASVRAVFMVDMDPRLFVQDSSQSAFEDLYKASV